MTEINKQAVLDVLNSLKVIDRQGGDDAYILVKNSPENRAKLKALGVTDDQINGYGDSETFCILALAFGDGYANDYESGNLVWREVSAKKERAQRLVDLSAQSPTNDAIEEYKRALEHDAVPIAKAYLDALAENERLKTKIEEMTKELGAEIDELFWKGKEVERLRGALEEIDKRVDSRV